MHRTALLTLVLFAALALAHSYLARTRISDGSHAVAMVSPGVSPAVSPGVSNADDHDQQKLSSPGGDHRAPTEAADISTPNHDPHHLNLIETAAVPVTDRPASADAAIVRAEPVAAAPSIPAFVTADSTLYARANARLRTAPSTASEVVAKLAANVRLHATGRSTDGLWWQVPLGDQRTGYIHRDAVTTSRIPAQMPAETSPAEAAPAVVAAAPPMVPQQRRQGPLDLVNNAIDWLSDVAAHRKGPAPKIIRTER